MKKLRRLLLLGLAIVLLAGCGEEKIPEGSMVVYHLNKDETAVVPVACEITGDSVEIKVEELLGKLEDVPDTVGLRRTIPENVKILSYTMEANQVYLDFSAEYLNMSKTTEILVRAAVVKTLAQLEEISFVGIRVNGETLKDSKGSSIGLMNKNTFLDNMGSDESATKQDTCNLYFSNRSGDKLKPQQTVMEYNSNVPLEKVIIEQLIAGPKEKGYHATIPKDTKVMSVTTKDGVCYVNLDSGFTAQGYDVLGTVTIYSIVNSLTEIPGITGVQILVNGETAITYKDQISLETIFQRNQEIVEKGD
jgi:germination protein M